jgi:hypothetical protein
VQRTLSILSLPLLLGAITACSSTADVPADPNDTGTPPLDGGGDTTPTPDGADTAPPPPKSTCVGSATINVGSSGVAEIRSTTALSIEVVVADTGGATDPHPVKVVIMKDGAPIKTLVDAAKPLGKLSFDFIPSGEKDLATGAYQIKADIGCPASATDAKPGTASATMYLVRLGATKIVVKDGDGGGRVPLMYHALDHSAANYFPIPDTMASSSLDMPSGEPELDKKDGTARPFPAAPWTDLDTPPVDGSGAVIETGNTIPVSLKTGTKPDLVFTIGKTAKSLVGSQPTGLAAAGLPAIRLVVEGVPGADTALVTEGGAATVRLLTSPVPAINKVDLPVKWHFEVKGTDGTYTPIAGGEQSVTLRFYGVLGNDQGTASPDLPWVAVVDEATTKIAGTANDAPKARAILVQHIYQEIGLAYDRKSGASAYTNYIGSPSWTAARFYLSDFMKRARGKIVNCTDCASILSTYANMIGAKLHYAIIGWSFSLNPIEGIGSTTFGSPFDSGGMGFSYHAVTSPDSTATIDDATLAVDGDSDPKTAPHTLELVQNIAGAEYLTRLSPGAPLYQYKDQVTNVR